MTNTLWTKIHMGGALDSLKDLKPLMLNEQSDEESQTPDTNARRANACSKMKMQPKLHSKGHCKYLTRQGNELIKGNPPHIKSVVSKRNNLSGWSSKTNSEKGWQKWPRIKLLVTILVQQTNIPAIVQRQRKKSMPLRKSQRRNPQQRILNQTVWEIPSENNLMNSKSQENNF
ncbi:hypothetical protein O181_026752 [Austropuccinia psidii MF-1]|uniref:Uncharacterized protein n=1 Tax=Austropuccinia psidii MF-1 TaxID=1389203 RepID=A0A9Q3CR79_9BASI|nr:hypothetical protein [Austropuccinia psidii MF-1]